MADSRELTFGMDFGLDDALGKLNDAIDRLESLADSAGEAEDAAQDMGAQFRAGTDALRDSTRDASDAMGDLADSAGEAGDGVRDLGRDGSGALDDMDDRLGNIGSQFRAMGRDADSFGQSVSKSMGTALKSGDSLAKSLKAGFQGAIGYTEKRFNDFSKKVTTGAKKIGTAFKHPIQTIKDKLGDALLGAGRNMDDMGDQADNARKDLEDMGDAGSDAGNQIKDALKGAVTAVIGLEAIKAGIDKLKELGAAALEAAGAAENVGKKFDACFDGTDASEWVDNFASSIHRSTAEVQEFMVSNKAMYAELGVTGEAATELSKITTSLAYDFGNAFSMNDADALAVVQDYINGNCASLEEYGVHIDDVALKNSAMELGLGSQIEELDDAAMAQVRMNALLGQSEKIQQAAITQTGGLVNSQKSLNGVWQEFLADAGAKFSPVLEGLYGIIMDSWPTVEPMLMELVEILSEGLSQAMPVLMELGQTLIPVLTSVLGTLFQAAMPLLSVFGELAQTILPPVAEIVGMIADTVMPPLVDILSTLNTAIIQPLVPVIQKIAEALLPPISQVLGLISPILEAISPVLSVIGDVLGVIAEVLGKVIGWLADGVGKVVGFFSNLFGGAKDSKEAVDELSGSVDGLDEVTSKETSLAVDTSDYKEKVEGAAETASSAVKESSNEAKEITDVNFMAMGASATAAYGTMQTDAESAWSAMTTAAENGANQIVAAFDRIKAAAQSASSAANISVGANIPHNAGGTDDFEGGPTWMNERGGELAVLPSGSAIIPADQTDRLMQSYTSTTNNSNSVSMAAPSIQISIQGNADADTVNDMEARLRAIFADLYQEAQERDYMSRSLQAGFA